MATNNSLYLVPFAAGDVTTSKLRVSVKTSGAENIFSSIIGLRIITDILPPITTTNNYMTIYHAGKDNGAGLGIFLKYMNGDYYIGVRYIVKNGVTWNEENDTVKSAPDFSVDYTFTATNISNGAQWGFGSSPQTNTAEYGLITGNNYNSYSCGGCYLSHLQGWTTYIQSSSSAATYSLFNTNPSFSIYTYILYNQLIAANTTNLVFELDIPNALISSLGNAATSPATLVTLTPSSSSYSPTPNFGVNGDTTAASPIVVAVTTIECIYTGMKVLTTRGYVPVDDLQMSDQLITDKFKVVDILRIYRYFVVPSQDTVPRIIPKGMYGAIEDTYISQFHLFKTNEEFVLPKDMDFQLMPVYNAAPLCYYHVKVDNYLENNIVVNGVVMEAHTTSNYEWLAKQNKHEECMDVDYELEYSNDEIEVMQ